MICFVEVKYMVLIDSCEICSFGASNAQYYCLTVFVR
jgi:hypothetical protein